MEKKKNNIIVVQGSVPQFEEYLNTANKKGYVPYGAMTSVVIQDEIVHTQIMIDYTYKQVNRV